MAEQLLDDPEVGAAVEQMGGEGVAQCMRVRRGQGEAVEDPPDVAGSSRAPRRFTKTASAGPGIWVRPSSATPQRRNRSVMDGDPPLLAALSQHGHGAPVQVDPATVEPAELGDPQASGVEELEYSQVALIDGRSGGPVQEGSDLAFGQHPGQAPLPRGAPSGSGRVLERGGPAGADQAK